MKKFFKSLISSESTDSAKRFITLFLAAHFIIAGFVILFLVCYLVAVTPKGTVNKDLVGLLGDILQNDMFVILSGLGFIGLENWSQIQLEKAKAIAGANILTGNPNANTLNIENLNQGGGVEHVEDLEDTSSEIKKTKKDDR